MTSTKNMRALRMVKKDMHVSIFILMTIITAITDDTFACVYINLIDTSTSTTKS